MTLDIIFICVTVVVCVFLLSHANVHITITRNEPVAPVVENNPQLTQETVDELYAKEKPFTIDDVVSSLNDILGGD